MRGNDIFARAQSFKLNHKNIMPLLIMGVGLIAAIILSIRNGYFPISNYETRSDEHLFMWLRVDLLQIVADMLKQDGYYSAFSIFFDHNANYYFYLAHIMNAFNLTPAATFLLVQVGAIFALMIVFPALIYKITNSILMTIFCLLFLAFNKSALLFFPTDSYWAYYLIVCFALPSFYILWCEKWSKTSVALTLGLSLVIAIINLPRSNTAIVVWVTLLATIIIKNYCNLKQWLKSKNIKGVLSICAVLLVVLMSYSFFTDTVISIYVQATGENDNVLEQKGPWHSMFIGLGWEENPDDIIFNDGRGYEEFPELMNNENPYFIETPEYIEAIKGKYFDTILGNPGFYIMSYIRKIFACIAAAASATIWGYLMQWFPPIIGIILLTIYLFVVITLFIFVYKREKAKFIKDMLLLLLSTIVCIAGGLIFGLLAVPSLTYNAGISAALDILTVLLPTILVARAFVLYTRNKDNSKEKPAKV